MMYKIGLTGGIGSGKTTIAGIFKHLGIPVYNSDENAKRLMHSDPHLKNEIITAFGHESYLKDGTINKEHLRTFVFGDASSREQMNNIVHPAVGNDFNRWVEAQNAGFALFESALLFQSASKKLLDYIFAVSASEPIRMERTMKRDMIDEASAKLRIESQMKQTEVDVLSDEVIVNDGKQLVIPQVIELIKKYSNG